MPYIASEEVAQMRKLIRKALPEFEVSVTKHHHSSVEVRLMRGPIAPSEVNVYWYKDKLKDRPDVVAVVDKVLGIIKQVKTPRTIVEDDDYGNVPNFYYDISFGKWDKPYVCTDPDAEDRTQIWKEFNQIRRFEEQEERYQASRCGIVTLRPDDLRLPCTLTAGHSGYCDTGR